MTTLLHSDRIELAHCRGINGFTELPTKEAVKVCEGCPVRTECLELSLAHEVVAGDEVVYGGLDGRQRYALHIQRRKANGMYGKAPGALTEAQKDEIGARYIRGAGGNNYGNGAALATEFGVTPQTIRAIGQGRRA